MGTCFSCCRGKIMRKQSQGRTFLLAESANEEETHDNKECMELEQRAESTAETQTCTNEASEVTKVTKPNKLLFRKPHFNWLRNDNQLIPGSHHRKEMKSPADSVMPLLHRESSFAETCSFTESQKWEQLSNGATPSSSVDLEWENEIGFNSANFGATEEMQWTVLAENNTNNSWRSSPVSNSNGLEWDGDFTTIDISEIVTGTQKLTSELDNVDQDNSEIVYRDIENNN